MGYFHHEMRLTFVLWAGSLGANAGKMWEDWKFVNQTLISWLSMTFGLTDNVQITIKKFYP